MELTKKEKSEIRQEINQWINKVIQEEKTHIKDNESRWDYLLRRLGRKYAEKVMDHRMYNDPGFLGKNAY